MTSFWDSAHRRITVKGVKAFIEPCSPTIRHSAVRCCSPICAKYVPVRGNRFENPAAPHRLAFFKQECCPVVSLRCGCLCSTRSSGTIQRPHLFNVHEAQAGRFRSRSTGRRKSQQHDVRGKCETPSQPPPQVVPESVDSRFPKRSFFAPCFLYTAHFSIRVGALMPTALLRARRAQFSVTISAPPCSRPLAWGRLSSSATFFLQSTQRSGG